MRVETQGLKLAVYCKCGRRMLFSIEGYTCLAVGKWNFFWHDKPVTYGDARKLVDGRKHSDTGGWGMA